MNAARFLARWACTAAVVFEAVVMLVLIVGAR